jgi:hypothetical protein
MGWLPGAVVDRNSGGGIANHYTWHAPMVPVVRKLEYGVVVPRVTGTLTTFASEHVTSIGTRSRYDKVHAGVELS